MLLFFYFSGAGGGQCQVRSQRAWRCRVLRRYPRLHAYTCNNCKERSGRSDPPLYSSQYAPGHLIASVSSLFVSSFHCFPSWFSLPPQAMFLMKLPPSHPTVTQRSGSSPAGGKRLWSTAGMLPRRLLSAQVQPGSSSALGAPRKPWRDQRSHRQQEGSLALARRTCSPVQVLKLVSGIWIRRSHMLWPTWITHGSGKTPIVVQERKVMKQEVRVWLMNCGYARFHLPKVILFQAEPVIDAFWEVHIEFSGPHVQQQDCAFQNKVGTWENVELNTQRSCKKHTVKEGNILWQKIKRETKYNSGNIKNVRFSF